MSIDRVWAIAERLYEKDKALTESQGRIPLFNWENSADREYWRLMAVEALSAMDALTP